MNKKENLLKKILESELTLKLIYKVQDIYHNISDKLFIKYDLKNELKQGKIFTILITFLIFLFLIILTTFFVIMLNSLLGLNLIFNMIKYSLFIFKWGYTILKSKGKMIEKYLINLFPNNKIFKKTNEIEIKNIPNVEENIVKEIKELLSRIEKLDDKFSSDKKEIVFEIKRIVGVLNINDIGIKNDISNLEYQMNIVLKNENKEFNNINLLDDIVNIECDKEYEKKYIKTL